MFPYLINVETKLTKLFYFILDVSMILPIVIGNYWTRISFPTVFFLLAVSVYFITQLTKPISATPWLRCLQCIPTQYLGCAPDDVVLPRCRIHDSVIVSVLSLKAFKGFKLQNSKSLEMYAIWKNVASVHCTLHKQKNEQKPC